MPSSAPLAGFVAASGDLRSRIADAVAFAGPGADIVDRGAARLAHWGVIDLPSEAGATTFSVSRVVRGTGGRVADDVVAAALREYPASLVDLLPPFGGVHADDEGIQMVADGMGFQHLYVAETSHGALMSNTALAAARTISPPLDEAGVGVQSLLGWQLGTRTLFRGIEKLPPGAVARLAEGTLHVDARARRVDDTISLAEAVEEAAALLRTSLNAVLDDHPDAVLQLTGGMDSRLLLSAIPPARRRGLRAMTLDVPGKGDVAIAAQIAERYGIEHDVRGLTEVSSETPADAWRLCRVEAGRLDAMSDPVALAAQRIAERKFEQGVRISGLGGEVARGFYYVGRVADRNYGRRDAARLASWRMFANDSVEPGLLTDEFVTWARETAVDAVYAALRAGGPEWFRATDELYLRHRMQRWAGATDVAVSAERTVINPMLDSAFLEIARRLSPGDKANARFLALLQERLDPELSRIPLDGRPAPTAYAHPSVMQPLKRSVGTVRRLGSKAVQRLQRQNRPPAGGDVLAARVVEHWREHREVLAPLSGRTFIRPEWIDQVLEGRIQPRPSTVAFVTNILVATGAE